MKSITFGNFKESSLLAILFSYISIQFGISISYAISLKSFQANFEIYVIILSYFFSEILGIICFYLFKKYEKNNNFNIKTAVYGCLLGFLHYSYFNFLQSKYIFNPPFLLEYPYQYTFIFGYSFISSIICYEICLKSFNKKNKLLISLIIIIFFIILIRTLIIKGAHDVYHSYFYSAIGIGIQFAVEKYSIEKEELNIYLLMFFEGISSSLIHITHCILYDRNFKTVDGDNFKYIFYYIFIYFVINISRFYLAKYTNLLMNILIYLFVLVYFEQNIIAKEDETDIGFIFLSLCIFFGMCVYNEIINLNFLVLIKENENNNANENNNNENNVIQIDNKIENENINVLDKNEESKQD